jgi:hypothetical protein
MRKFDGQMQSAYLPISGAGQLDRVGFSVTKSMTAMCSIYYLRISGLPKTELQDLIGIQGEAISISIGKKLK